MLDPQYMPGQQVFFYQKPPFEAVYEGTAPDPAEIVSTATYKTVPDNTESLFINIYTRTDLDGAAVDISNLLQSGGPTIAAADIDVRVVRNWWQAGESETLSFYPVYRPELLLHDDNLDLSGDFDYQNLPSAPILTNALADIPAFTSKQYVITVKVPANALNGNYTGTLSLTSGAGTYQLPIVLNVNDINLEPIDKVFMTYYRGAHDRDDLVAPSAPSDPEAPNYDSNL
jgi:hypothetical protein